MLSISMGSFFNQQGVFVCEDFTHVPHGFHLFALLVFRPDMLTALPHCSPHAERGYLYPRIIPMENLRWVYISKYT